MQEIWKDIKGYEGIFQVSDSGRVRRFKKNKITILKGSIDRKGYRYVRLSVKNKKRRVLIHRLVAQAFCYKPIGCDLVNHLDNNPFNNCASNLEWTTPKGNTLHALKQGRLKSKETITIAIEARKKPVVARKDDIEKCYMSMTEAEREGFDHRHISECCRGIRKTHKGFTWKYLEKSNAY